MNRIGSATAVTLTLLSAAAHAQRVDVYVPLNRLEAPEPGGRTFGATLGPMGLVRLRLTADQALAPPDTTQPEIRAAPYYDVRIDATPLPILSVGAQHYFGVGWSAQAKLMPLQPLLAGTPFALALTIEYGEGDDDFGVSPVVPRTNVHQTVVDYGVVAGVRVTPRFLVFGGPYRSEMQYGGEHYRRAAGGIGAPAGGETETVFADTAALHGAHLGAAWTFASWGRVVGEISRADVHAHASREMVWTPAVAFEVSFGPLRAATRQSQRASDVEPSVRVVPVEGASP